MNRRNFVTGLLSVPVAVVAICSSKQIKPVNPPLKADSGPPRHGMSFNQIPVEPGPFFPAGHYGGSQWDREDIRRMQARKSYVFRSLVDG